MVKEDTHVPRQTSLSHFLRNNPVLRTMSILIPGLIVTSLLLVSCPGTITEEDVSRVTDENVPVVTILVPADGSYYARNVLVEGTVVDKSGSEGAGEVRYFFYEILGTIISEQVPLSDDGSFSFHFSTASLAGPVTVRLYAEDWNGNRGEASVTLLQADNDIPSFFAAPDNHRVTLTWDPVPLTESYTLYYTTNGTYPSENYGREVADIESPYQLDGLKNGSLHVFILQAHSSQAEDSWSGFEQAIPLSSFTLAPRVTGEYGQIRVEWLDIPGADQFEVWRATAYDGEYDNISGTLNGNSMTDVSVEKSQMYFYKVKPVLEGSVESYANCARVCPFPPPGDEIVGSLSSLDYSLAGIDVAGKYAYLSRYDSGGPFDGNLQILDISNPNDPFVIGSIDLDDDVYGVSVVGDVAYVAGLDKGLMVVDVSSPTSPSLVTTMNIDGYAFGVSANDQYACVAVFNDIVPENIGLMVYDISIPTNPVERGFLTTPGYATAVTLSGDYALVSVNDFDTVHGISLVDVTGLTGPQALDFYSTPEQANGTCSDGNLVYVATGDSGLYILSIDDQAQLVKEGDWATSDYANDVSVQGNYACVALGDAGVEVLDVEDPSLPASVKVIPPPGSYNMNFIEFEDGLVYVSCDSRFLVIDPCHLYEIEVLKFHDMTTPTDVAIFGEEYVCVADRDNTSGGMYIIEITDPSNPVQVGLYQSEDLGYVRKIAISGHYAFVAGTLYSGVGIVDISDPADPREIAISSLTDRPSHLWVYGEYLFVADDHRGLVILDISEPDSPKLAGVFEEPPGSTPTWWVSIKDDIAYVAYQDNGLLTLDISNLNNPEKLATLQYTPPESNPSWEGDTRAVAVRDNLAYVGDRSGYLHVIDVSQPDNLVDEDKYLYLGGQIGHLHISGNHLFIPSWPDSFKIFDISDPASLPAEIASMTPTGSPDSITVSGDLAYGTDGDGLYILELWNRD